MYQNSSTKTYLKKLVDTILKILKTVGLLRNLINIIFLVFN